MMEPVGISGMTEDYLIQPSRTLLGCIIETKGAPSAEPGVSLKMVDVDREFDACSMSDVSMQCMGVSETGNYGEQVLPDQLLSFAMPKPQPEERREAGRTEEDPEQAGKDMYEGLLDKCGGEDGLLTSSNQDWGYIESFISESKMELLDLCSKNELSVNLFSEEDVNNYMFDDDDEDSALSSDMCSLKIRYESFQDNMREKTNVLHEETQFNFFPSVLASDAKAEGGVKPEDGVPDKPEDLEALGSDGKDNGGFLERPSSPKVNYFVDSGNSADDSEEFGVDSSSSRSSFESFHESNHKSAYARKNACASSPLNYGLREKRKVRYSDDYLYDVDSIENEKNHERREQPPPGPREEQDDDWCPKKRKKSSRKESPVIIKYIIINKFKGEKHTCVKLGKIDPEITTVSLNKDAITEYEKLAPLKDFWQHKQEEGKHHLQNDDLQRLLGSGPTQGKHGCEDEPRTRRILMASEEPEREREPCSSDPLRDAGAGGDAAAPAGASDLGTMAQAVTSLSRTRDTDERPRESTILRIRKFETRVGAPSEGTKEVEPGAEGGAERADVCEVGDIKDAPAAGEGSEIHPDPESPQSHIAPEGNEKYTYMPTPCPSNEATPADVDAGMPVIPGGYLQTLLDASDSLNGPGISMLSRQTSREHAMGLTLEGRDFASLQMAQSCVLSPPSESELQQSPHDCPGLARMWHPQLGPDQQFALPMSDNLPVPEYAQLSLDGSGMLYDKSYLPGQAAPPETVFQACRVPGVEDRLRFQTAAPHADDPRLGGFDLVGSLSTPPGDYGPLSLEADKDGEGGDVNENFLSRCSPKLVTRQSPEAVTPLRESTDLLDISNFTPDKFRHASLSSELSPPETPDLSPQVAGRDTKADERRPGVRGGPGAGTGVKWYRDDLSTLAGAYTDGGGGEPGFDRAANVDADAKVSKSKRKSGAKQAAGQTQKKGKASKPKASKGDKVKAPRQNSRASKKLKALLDEKSGRAQTGESTPVAAGGGFSENSVHADYQQEFEEPSNILSNIASGMAEVQRFMMASIEPTWGPATGVSLPSESNSLSLKTLKILAGTAGDPKRRGAASAGATRSRKGSKNQAKFNPLFPQLPLGCNVFEKSGLGVPGPNGPAHKKMYRHKTSAKFPRVENFKGKQADSQGDVALMASFEKLR